MTSWQAEARRLVRERLDAEPGRIAALWAEVETEAWQEVRAELKAAMVDALLEELGQRIETDKRIATDERLTDAGSDNHREGQTQAGELPEILDVHIDPQDQLPASVPDREAPTSGIGVYVYGVIDCTELAGLPEAGVTAGHPVTLLPYRDLAAVVSEVPLDEWGQAALEARLADLTWLEASVRKHQAVLDELLPLATLAPMKFATIYLSQEGVSEFLAEHYGDFVTLLAQLKGRQEWGLKLYCADETLAAHIAEVSPEVAELRAEVAGKPKGAAYLLTRKLQEASDCECERVEMEVADRAHTDLCELCVAATLNPLQGTEITGRTDRMLLNAAYLVDATALEAFRNALVNVAAEYGDVGFLFELSGPWPAYNFAGLVERDSD